MTVPLTAMIYGLSMIAANVLGSHLGLDTKVTGLFTLLALGAFGFQIGWTIFGFQGKCKNGGE